MWGTFSDERTVLSFTIAAGPRQRSNSRVRVTRDSRSSYFTVSDSRLPQPGGPGPRFYIPQEQNDSVIPTGTGFHFRRLLRLAGLRWEYSNQTPRGGSQPVLSEIQSKCQGCFTTGGLPPINSSSESNSKLCYDRRSVGQSVLMSNPTWVPRPNFCYCRTVAGLLM
jgi:hypothetical protein